MNLAVDASVACKWFLNESDSSEARQLLHPRHTLFASDVVYVEAMNALLKALRRNVVVQQPLDDIVMVLTTSLQPFPARDVVAEACRVALHGQRGSVYDLTYVLAAKQLGVPFVPADRNQIIVARQLGLIAHQLGTGTLLPALAP